MGVGCDTGSLDINNPNPQNEYQTSEVTMSSQLPSFDRYKSFDDIQRSSRSSTEGIDKALSLLSQSRMSNHEQDEQTIPKISKKFYMFSQKMHNFRNQPKSDKLVPSVTYHNSMFCSKGYSTYRYN